MGEEFDLNNCTLYMNGVSMGSLKGFQTSKLDTEDIKSEIEDTPFKSFTGEIQITKFKKSKGLRKLFLEMDRMIDLDKYISYKKYLKRVENRNKLYKN
jgi:hypothetical protein